MKLKVLLTLLAATCSLDGNCTSQKFFHTSHESALRQASAGLQGETDEPMSEVIERALTRAHRQAQILADSMERHQKRLPKTFERGRLRTCDYGDWVSGFFPGTLWMLGEHFGDTAMLNEARRITARVEPAKRLKNTHDLGFMLNCSFGHAYRITGEMYYLDVLREGAQSLLTRWNGRVGALKSWNTNRRWQYPVIIDNMMNLEFLCFIARETGDKWPRKVATKHANTTLRNHFRRDYSTYHVVSYDTITGRPHAKNTAQGCNDSSAWARGQSWGLYGYTMMYRQTHKAKYLRQARRIASFLVSHPRLPADKVPYWDYDAPGIPNAKRDASAAAIMASALIELSQLDKGPRAAEWLAVAEKQLRTLSSSTYLAEEGEQAGFILRHSVGHLPGGWEVDVPLTYADYYYVEAMLRLQKIIGAH